ncbi:MAG: ATP-dependent helicase/nuclease subunit [Acidobacteriota bacterium]|jgi:ATP-dependent helicase/nuclease subunit A|nr:ATP-dependent helicase/nuclease subunit [Acidobacteriota bacterium]
MTAGRLLVGAFGSRRDDERLRQEDREARLEAQRRFDRPLVLEAGAGTGKTTTLIGRLLAWVIGAGWERKEHELAERAAAGLRTDGSPDRIAASILRGVVAITFTEAAAAEMASRATLALGALARGDEPPPWLDPAVLPPPEERTRRARALASTLDHLAVRTIHAFCRGLLADHPLEAGIHPDLAIDADGLLLQEVVHETVEASLREGYGDPGDPDLLELAARGFGPREVSDALTALVLAGLPAEVLEEDPVAPERVGELRRRLVEACEGMHDLVGPLLTGVRLQNPKAIEHGVADLLARLLEEGPLPLEMMQEHAAELLPGNLLEHLRKWARGSLGPTEGRLLGEVREDLAARAGRLCRLLDHLDEVDSALLGAARKALSPRLAEVARLLRIRGIATFDSLLTGAERLLARHPEVRARVRRGIDQLLVDEFQDTDQVQCEILRWIALDGPPEQRPGLFLVGDPKQSIYGWRSADLRAYDGFLERVRQGWGEVRPLVENFRSVPAILEEVARGIEPVMRARTGLQPRFEPLLPCERRKDDPGFLREDWAPVEHWVSWTKDGGHETLAVEATELEAAAIASDLVALHRRGEPWSEMAILLRGMSQVDLYLEALRRVGAPFAVGRDKHYYRRREVIDAAALVRAVLDPGDHLALLTFLRSPTVGVPDAALIPLWNNDFPKLMTELAAENVQVVADRIAKAARELPRDIPALDRVRGWDRTLLAAVEALAALRGSFTTDPADVFIEKVRGLLLVDVTEAARYLGPYRLANLDRFFRQLLSAMEDGGGDATAVLRALRRSVAEAREAEEGRPQDGSEDAVQVMTIHGAKGLDFKHVYLAQLHKQSMGESASKTEVGRAGDDGGEYRWEYRLFGAPTLGFDAVAAERREVEAAERVRTLYVAMTRAKDRLVLIGTWPESEEDPRQPEQARHHLDLLLWRPGRPELAQRWAEGAWSFPDRTGALWKLPALRPAAEAGEAGGEEAAALLSPEEIAREAAVLAGRRKEAEARMERPFGGAASEEAHELLREQQSERRVGERVRRRQAPDRADRESAMAAGGAVHRALETWDLFAGPEEEARRQRDLLPVYIARLAEGDVLDRALPLAQSLLDRFASSGLLVRLRDLREHVLARELPVLLPPSGSGHGSVGFISGTIDLLYRDPATGRLVVADYKTDDPETLEARVAVYAPQGATYVRALGEALGLKEPPRFELWFLQADRVV